MSELKLPLKYFAHLIDLDGLAEKRKAAYEECVGRTMGQGAQITDDETIVYEDYEGSFKSKFPQLYFAPKPFAVVGTSKPQPTLQSLKPAHVTIRDLREEICSEVKQQTSKSKVMLYEQLNTGTQEERELVYKQARRSLDNWSEVVAGSHLYNKYSCIAAALQEISKYIGLYSPLSSEAVAMDSPTPVIESVVGFFYQYVEAGEKPARIKAITQRRLDNFYHVLKDELELIAPETTLENFRTVFSGKPVSVPLRWLGTNAQLRHLIMAIEPILLLSSGGRGLRLRNKWKIAAACFVNSDGRILEYSQIMSTGTGKEVRLALGIDKAAKKLG